MLGDRRDAITFDPPGLLEPPPESNPTVDSLPASAIIQVQSMSRHQSRRAFLRRTGVTAAALPFLMNLSSLGWASTTTRRKRLVVIFTPNGTIPSQFWPDEEGRLETFKRILQPLEPLRDQTLTLHGVCDKIRGDGDNHMRGIACLLTGVELFPGDIQGGSHTPAGWAKGISLDQHLKNLLQAEPTTRTRFGSLEFGVMVPDRADTWTRLCYADANQPVTPIDNPYQMFDKLYGQVKDRQTLASVLDVLQEDFRRVEGLLSAEDRTLLAQHAAMVREMEQEIDRERKLMADKQDMGHAVPELPENVDEVNDNIPQLSKMQIDLMVNAFIADFNRIATMQYTNSVGGAKMKWLGVEEGHHQLSHEPFSNEDAVEKLAKINTWFCEQVAYLATRLAETPEPGGGGSMLDNTTIVWTNELGEGNSHTLDNIPFVLVGGGLDFKMGRAVKYKKVPHNRLLLSIAQGMGHPLETFGNPDYCADGPLADL